MLVSFHATRLLLPRPLGNRDIKPVILSKAEGSDSMDQFRRCLEGQSRRYNQHDGLVVLGRLSIWSKTLSMKPRHYFSIFLRLNSFNQNANSNPTPSTRKKPKPGLKPIR
jgi:hypothetical protein